MRKLVLVPVISTGLLFACSDSKTSAVGVNEQQQDKTVMQKQIQKAWVGHYQGITPCESCLSHCEGCDGTAVDLVLKPDLSYELTLQRLSSAATPQVLSGKMYFKDTAQSYLELSNIKKRHSLVYDRDNDQFEILDDVTGQSYEFSNEFILEKVV